MKSTGTLFTVSAPSGAGKTSLVKALVENNHFIQVSVSHTTRPRRPGEIDGKDYHFIDTPSFTTMLEEGAFLEQAQVFGNYYGTSRYWVEETLAMGNDVVLEIDWQGALQVRHLLPKTLGIFILPPSMDALRQRLNNRGQDNGDTINHRVAEAKAEISHYVEADFIIINDDFDTALCELHNIIASQRLTLTIQQQQHQQLLKDLLS